MNIFLTSLMHRETAQDFSVVEHYFELMAHSVCAQTDQDFLLVVVCNQIPDISLTHKNIIYHLVDFPPAKNISDTRLRRLDKGTKIIAGLLHIKQYKPKYVHILDADDWIHIDLNKFLNTNEQIKSGWYISSGYKIDLSKNKQQLKYGIQRFSGSAFICHYETLIELLNINEKLTASSNQNAIIECVPCTILLDLIDSHGYMAFYSQYKLKFKLIPFKALAWIRNTGENILSDGPLKDGIYLDKKLLSLFGLENTLLKREYSNSIWAYSRCMFSALYSFSGWIGSIMLSWFYR